MTVARWFCRRSRTTFSYLRLQPTKRYASADCGKRQSEGNVTLVSLCRYGGDVVASVTVEDEEWAPEFARMLELLFGETHYAVVEELPDPGF
jgi:hypothetical protein